MSDKNALIEQLAGLDYPDWTALLEAAWRERRRREDLLPEEPDDPPPFTRLRGPVSVRGGVSGVLRVGGEELAAWGEPDRADQTFSVGMPYLALLAGIAHSRGWLVPGERGSERLPLVYHRIHRQLHDREEQAAVGEHHVHGRQRDGIGPHLRGRGQS